MTRNRTTFFRKRISAFGHAFRGIGYLFRNELHARIHALFALSAIILGFYFSISRTEWVIIILCIGIVFAAEAINTSIERLADALHPENHELIKHAKDTAAGAVLLVAIASLIIGIFIFGPKIAVICQ